MGFKVAGTLQSQPLALVATLYAPGRGSLHDGCSFPFDGIVLHIQKFKNAKDHNSLKLEKGVNRQLISV